MFKGNVKVQINASAIAQQKQQAIKAAQIWLDKEIVRQTDPFVPMDTGMLASSPRRASTYGSGKIVYNMPYARRLYYGVRFMFSRDKHPRATHHWFEKAKSIYLDAWGNAVAKLLGGAWRRGA